MRTNAWPPLRAGCAGGPLPPPPLPPSPPSLPGPRRGWGQEGVGTGWVGEGWEEPNINPTLLHQGFSENLSSFWLVKGWYRKFSQFLIVLNMASSENLTCFLATTRASIENLPSFWLLLGLVQKICLVSDQYKTGIEHLPSFWLVLGLVQVLCLVFGQYRTSIENLPSFWLVLGLVVKICLACRVLRARKSIYCNFAILPLSKYDSWLFDFTFVHFSIPKFILGLLVWIVLGLAVNIRLVWIVLGHWCNFCH